jgi:hypothetical protein
MVSGWAVCGPRSDPCFPGSADSGVKVPEPLEQWYRLYCRELGEDTLDRLLLLQSMMSSPLQVRAVRATRHAQCCPILPGLPCPGPVRGKRRPDVTIEAQVQREGGQAAAWHQAGFRAPQASAWLGIW